MKRTLKARLMLVTLAVLLLLSPICMASNIAVTSADTAVPISDDSQTNAVDNSNSDSRYRPPAQPGAHYTTSFPFHPHNGDCRAPGGAYAD